MKTFFVIKRPNGVVQQLTGKGWNAVDLDMSEQPNNTMRIANYNDDTFELTLSIGTPSQKVSSKDVSGLLNA